MDSDSDFMMDRCCCCIFTFKCWTLFAGIMAIIFGVGYAVPQGLALVAALQSPMLVPAIEKNKFDIWNILTWTGVGVNIAWILTGILLIMAVNIHKRHLLLPFLVITPFVMAWYSWLIYAFWTNRYDFNMKLLAFLAIDQSQEHFLKIAFTVYFGIVLLVALVSEVNIGNHHCYTIDEPKEEVENDVLVIQNSYGYMG